MRPHGAYGAAKLDQQRIFQIKGESGRGPGSLITLNEAFDEPLGKIRHFAKAA